MSFWGYDEQHEEHEQAMYWHQVEVSHNSMKKREEMTDTPQKQDIRKVVQALEALAAGDERFERDYQELRDIAEKIEHEHRGHQWVDSGRTSAEPLAVAVDFLVVRAIGEATRLIRVRGYPYEITMHRIRTVGSATVHGHSGHHVLTEDLDLRADRLKGLQLVAGHLERLWDLLPEIIRVSDASDYLRDVVEEVTDE